MNRLVWNPWPTTPAAIRASSRIGARSAPPSLFRVAARRLGPLVIDLALCGGVLYLFAALYCAA